MPGQITHVPTELNVATMLREAGDSRSSASATFGPDDASVTVPYIVEVEDLPQDSLSWIWNDIICTILGYARADGTILHREPALRHPLFPSLHATRVTNMRGESPMDYFWSEPSRPGVDESEAKVDEFFNLLIADPKQVGWWKFKRIAFDVEYTLPPWDIKTDEDTTAEYQRHVVYDTEADIEVYEFQGGSFRYVGLFDSSGNPRPFISVTAAILGKQTLRMTWKDVPKSFLMPEGEFFPTKFTEVVGKVNEFPIFGKEAGTLLAKPIKITRKKKPLFLTDGAGIRVPSIVYDVEFEFSYFKPPLAGGLSYVAAGHNLFPSRDGDDGTEIKYYLATNNGTLSGRPLFAKYDFEKLFTHWSL